MRTRLAATSITAIAVLAGIAALALPAPAAAAKPCWERVMDDWLADGAINGTYKVSCLQQALKNVPEDLRDYSNITDAIGAAIQDRLRARNGGDGGGGTPNGSGNGNGSSPSGEKPRQLQNAPSRSYYRRAIDNLGTTSTDSLPIPLIVLASLGGLLLLSAGGMIGARRIKALRAAHREPPSEP